MFVDVLAVQIFTAIPAAAKIQPRLGFEGNESCGSGETEAVPRILFGLNQSVVGLIQQDGRKAVMVGKCSRRSMTLPGRNAWLPGTMNGMPI